MYPPQIKINASTNLRRVLQTSYFDLLQSEPLMAVGSQRRRPSDCGFLGTSERGK